MKLALLVISFGLAVFGKHLNPKEMCFLSTEKFYHIDSKGLKSVKPQCTAPFAFQTSVGVCAKSEAAYNKANTLFYIMLALNDPKIREKADFVFNVIMKRVSDCPKPTKQRPLNLQSCIREQCSKLENLFSYLKSLFVKKKNKCQCPPSHQIVCGEFHCTRNKKACENLLKNKELMYKSKYRACSSV